MNKQASLLAFTLFVSFSALVGFAVGFGYGRSDAKAQNELLTEQRSDGYCDICFPRTVDKNTDHNRRP